jgi:hypothetical protein
MIALQGRGMGDMKEQFRRGMEGCIRDKLRQFKHSMSLGSEKEIEEDLIAMGITGRGSRGKGKWKDFEVVDSEEGEDGREV